MHGFRTTAASKRVHYLKSSDQHGRVDFLEAGKSRFLEIQNFGTWKSGNLGPNKSKKKISKSKSVLPKMSARSGLVGKNPPSPIWGHLRPFFPLTGKISKMQKKCLFSLVGQWALFTRFGPPLELLLFKCRLPCNLAFCQVTGCGK